MSKDEWYSKLNKWAHEDSRLERMPLVYLRVLAEHIANEQAVEHRVHQTGRSHAVGEANSENYVRWQNGDLPEEPASR